MDDKPQAPEKKRKRPGLDDERSDAQDASDRHPELDVFRSEDVGHILTPDSNRMIRHYANLVEHGLSAHLDLSNSRDVLLLSFIRSLAKGAARVLTTISY